MGVTAENVAAKYDVSRSTMDAFAAASQAKATAAQAAGRFKDQITGVPLPQVWPCDMLLLSHTIPMLTLQCCLSLKPCTCHVSALSPASGTACRTV